MENEDLETARAEARTRRHGAVPAAAMREPEIDERPRRLSKREEVTQAQELIVPPPRSRIENPRTIEIERFIPRAQIDPRYHHTPYYIGPRDVIGQEAFAVIRNAMARKKVVGLGYVVLSNPERPIILEPMGLGLRGITLRYTHEIRSEAEYFADIPEMVLPGQMVSLAEHIVDTRMANFDPAYLEDRYRSALLPMLRKECPSEPAPRTFTPISEESRRPYGHSAAQPRRGETSISSGIAEARASASSGDLRQGSV